MPVVSMPCTMRHHLAAYCRASIPQASLGSIVQGIDTTGITWQHSAGHRYHRHHLAAQCRASIPQASLGSDALHCEASLGSILQGIDTTGITWQHSAGHRYHRHHLAAQCRASIPQASLGSDALHCEASLGSILQGIDTAGITWQHSAGHRYHLPSDACGIDALQYAAK